MIPDACFSFAVDIAIETLTPVICFETVSPCCLWTSYLNLPTLIEAGDFPFQGDYRFREQGLNTKLYNMNKVRRETYSIVPTIFIMLFSFPSHITYLSCVYYNTPIQY